MENLRRIFEEYKYNDVKPTKEQAIALRNSVFSTAFNTLYEDREIKTYEFDKLLKEAYGKQGSKKKKQSTAESFLGVSSPYTANDKRFISKLYRGTVAFFNLDGSKNRQTNTDVDTIKQRLSNIVSKTSPKRLSTFAKTNLLKNISTSVNTGQLVALLGFAAS
jgi:elongation factor P hydroxylase